MDTEIPACLICGAPLAYTQQAEEMTCSVCGRKFISNARCENGHFVCDECHASPAYAVIRYACLSTPSKNPIEIADAIMQNAAVHMHGPEHHVLVGCALLAAAKNAGYPLDLAPALAEMERRGRLVPGGFCGLAGSCGAAVSAGMFLSILLKTTPLSEETWALGNLLTAACLTEIAAHGGPRCCKRDTFSALKTAAAFLDEHGIVRMDLPEKIICGFSGRNRECLREECPYHT
ncbi:MAG: DUF5714 domain-containing protein [Methanocorpusculum sp.]|nr:DUF5714 domain-containing protein [Methanocorpusculum sp.]